MSGVPVVLGIRPSSHGFAWIAFGSPLSIHDWGVVEARGDKNERCMRQVERLLARMTVHTLVLEAFEGTGTKSAPRIVRLCRTVIALAQAQGVEVVILGKGDVRACFASVGARTRHEIAAAIARSFDMLSPLLPDKRKVWEGPHRRMALFDAAALVIAHYQIGASGLFEDLKNTTESNED